MVDGVFEAKKPALIRDAASVEDVSGVLRARDVRAMLMGAGLDPKVQHVLEKLAEQSFHNDKQLLACVGAIGQMSDIIAGFVAVAERMKQTIQGLGVKVDDLPELGKKQ